MALRRLVTVLASAALALSAASSALAVGTVAIGLPASVANGGFAMGIDRFVARMAGEPDLRQVIAFPKVSSGSDPLTGAPTPVPAEALKELGLALAKEPTKG